MASPGKKVRRLVTKDEVGSVAVKLWKEKAYTEIAMGCKLQLNDVGVSFDKTENENVLHVNSQDQLLKMEVAPIVTIKLRGLVVADMLPFTYTSYQGKKVAVKVAVLKHGDDFTKVKVYDPAQFVHFEMGKKILLSQYRKRDDGLIIILRGDKVFRCGCSTVDEKMKE